MVKKLSGEDKSLWDQIRSEIDPLNKVKSHARNEISEGNRNDGNIRTNISHSTNTKNLERKFNAKKIDSEDNSPLLNEIKKVDEEGILFSGIHRKLEQRMKRGNITIDDTLDLHGMTPVSYTHLRAHET